VTSTIIRLGVTLVLGVAILLAGPVATALAHAELVLAAAVLAATALLGGLAPPASFIASAMSALAVASAACRRLWERTCTGPPFISRTRLHNL